MALTAKISPPTHAKLKQISEVTGKPMQLVLDEAIELYSRDQFFSALKLSVALTKAKPGSWEDELSERALWEKTLADGNKTG